MIASHSIENKIAGIEPTKVFTIEDLELPRDWRENIRVKLGRMVKSGQIQKVGRGKFYKPRTSVFGDIGPSPAEIVKDLMFTNDILTGYITGYTVWNQMGLTSQISNVIIIGTSRRRDSMRRGNFEIRFITQPNKISIGSIPLLQILDSIRLIKQIPDSSVFQSVKIIKKYISELDEKRLSTLVKLSKKYPPRVRALLGAILESSHNLDYAEDLKNTLNPTTTYSLGLNESTELNLTNWNIE